jgi:hypothetical protein
MNMTTVGVVIRLESPQNAKCVFVHYASLTGWGGNRLLGKLAPKSHSAGYAFTYKRGNLERFLPASGIVWVDVGSLDASASHGSINHFGDRETVKCESKRVSH